MTERLADGTFAPGHKCSEEEIAKITEGTKAAMAKLDSAFKAEMYRKASIAHKGKKHIIPMDFGLRVGIGVKRRYLADPDLKRRIAQRYYPKGPAHPNWKGGNYDHIPEFEAIREQILARDKHACQMCFGSASCVHHIDWNRKNNSPANLIALCRHCHSLLNNPKNDDREYLYICTFRESARDKIKQLWG